MSNATAKLKYKNEDDRCYGLAGMTITLAALDAIDRVVAISLDDDFMVDFINEYCVGKKVLLLSQGSVLRAFQILLRKRAHPWDDFTVEGMYHVGDDTNKKKNYGIIDRVF
jgi:hypothetical protein